MNLLTLRPKASGVALDASADASDKTRDEADLANTVSLSSNASEAMAAAARITGDGQKIRDSLDSAASAVLQLEQSIAMISDHASSTSQMLGEAVGLAHDNVARMNETAATANQAVTSLKRTDEVTRTLLSGVAEISRFLQSIGDISDKTSLLAINASIEAARAGEAGRGFAVVASQVQGLSHQTQKVTEDISDVITKLGDMVGQLTEVVGRAAEDVGSTAERSQQTATDLQRMCQGLDQGKQNVAEVSASLSEQTIAIRAISENVNAISIASQASATRAQTLIRVLGNSEKCIEERFAVLDGRDIKDYVLGRAKSDHFLWKKKLSEMLVGLNSLSEGELADHHSCRLGKWYDTVEDSTIRNHPAFVALAPPHAAVHMHGKAAARAYADGSVDYAVQEVEKMEAASDEVVRLLDELIAR